MLVGTGTNDTAETIALTRRVSDIGIEGVLVVTPYYSRPSQAGLADHFTQVANSTHLDVVLYDIPVRTGRRIEPETLLTLARRRQHRCGQGCRQHPDCHGGGGRVGTRGLRDLLG